MILTTSFICAQVLVFTGFYGLIVRRDNLVITLICLEISLLGVALLFAASSLVVGNFIGFLTFFMLLVLAGVESAIGLALVISYYRLRTSVR